MSQRIIPNIWCTGTAEETGEFYARAFSSAGFSASSEVESRYPTEGLLDFQKPLAGKPLTVAVQIENTQLILVNAGPEFSPNPSISFMLNFDPLMFDGDESLARERLTGLARELGVGGTDLMPLGEYPFSALYVWVQDRYGVSWQLMLTNPEGDPRPFVIPALMFDGPSQDRAAEAADYYVSVFASTPGGTEIGNRSPYGQPTGKASAEALAFGEFRIGEQWFMAADNGSGQDHGFTSGVSLQVNCDDQAEIDRLWEALSAVPQAEQCGWLVDQFGVSWQVVPTNMGELMEREGAFEHLLAMKKIVIVDI
ncbi:VOC family protein [Leucobacter denitrificans]|uniref:VOC family protein n=1 Tax=Leucobacter denitrificans TaxID=683042 RepID=A0A7G9S4U6_9MICO|nr:VOC family protein [Leucobacter denitrificans]QNN62871.1 VOC family protein [Leucobacter denitrificans]